MRLAHRILCDSRLGSQPAIQHPEWAKNTAILHGARREAPAQIPTADSANLNGTRPWCGKSHEKQWKVGREGVEPSPDFSERILSPRRLPFRHRPAKECTR